MSHISPTHTRESISRTTETDTNKISMYELATCRAENYLLKHRMSNCESTIEGLKQLVANITDKQLEIIGEMVEMRKKSIMPPRSSPWMHGHRPLRMVSWIAYRILKPMTGMPHPRLHVSIRYLFRQ
ncbi:uncharacterized protein LOC110176075 [Drosophila serrata]|uniref:uncharacterized protein LOC110176075 n=1 Tax=Drosophila serrata TaxID=7274 RepID=UPI000A1CF4E7|nr:uncharacterized protein LOC110176075 [Drosophila serrata]